MRELLYINLFDIRITHKYSKKDLSKSLLAATLSKGCENSLFAFPNGFTWHEFKLIEF